MDGPAEALIDLDAIAGNVEALRSRIPGPQLMAVVKADGYGHGMIPAAHAALAGGAQWLGVVHVHEALALRREGITSRVLCLTGVPGAAHEDAVGEGIDLAVDSEPLLAEIAAAAALAGRPARVHLKIDTGMARGGATAADWPDLVAAAPSAAAARHVVYWGIRWEHGGADKPGPPTHAAPQ
ncbi:MAG: alanine racemase, partial [Streptosporangiales bacterium]